MSDDRHADAREKKRANRKRMKVNNRSVFIIQQAILKRANQTPGDVSSNQNPKTKKVVANSE